MKKINLSIRINASVEKVWDAVTDENKYREQTSAFCPGSYFKGDWNKGSKILFLGLDPKSNGEGGMVSEIADNIQFKYISIKHNGYVSNSIEDTTSEEVKKWAPSYENYTFEERDGSTLFTLDMDATDEYYEYFVATWPKALEKLKEVAEKN